MKKTDVMKMFSSAREACEMVNHLLRSTGHRLASPGEIGPDPDRPYLVPLSLTERREKILEAWYWSMFISKRAQKAHHAFSQYAKDNGITVADIDNYGKKKGWL